ncbi:glucans biosynthesis glucosyltransferase MdoH [Calycomorphotria hydatis]|uniref:Glucans biosynthesis glucosyltransferase H n=1 Tax=Calycomorphotria hydatis TaxID=2528027 RepID=A0A517T7W0_9PLAN|nr:glucans biosynthesis glucosyltransferase MdoH [Calycomorphotria hydatis]QDT64452.1 Glucans biosynthesis glucosyltransferase H [Calycomorphotria hydatis]
MNFRPLETVVYSPREFVIGCTLFFTLVTSALFADLLAVDGFGTLDFVQVSLYAVLAGWVSFGFSLAALGFLTGIYERRLSRAGLNDQRSIEDINAQTNVAEEDYSAMPRAAILMPVYNEEPSRVLAGMQAMRESLGEMGVGKNFDFFLLSDSTNPDVWLEEEMAWSRLPRNEAKQPTVYYRHRPQNTARKSGNLADFCERWGLGYRYMIVLDADSVMSAETLVEMVKRMERDALIGILQVPPKPVHATSTFSRAQQFAASVYGPLFTRGYRAWCGDDGNYWGHNAIIRVAPFINHAGLPVLPGQAPLGGEVLSHDFVEAALMRRAGWKVVIADDLADSYEELPNTMLGYAQRDQRWCQGNLQHMNLLGRCQLSGMSRWHLASGALSFLASPLWLMFVLLTFPVATIFSMDTTSEDWTPFWGVNPHLLSVGLFCGVMGALILPKFAGMWERMAIGDTRRFGGAVPLVLSTILETFLSMLVAPIMMAFHSTFVVMSLLGKKVQWTAQQRGDNNMSLYEAWKTHRTHSVIGIAIIATLYYLAPATLFWAAPVLVGLALSIPLAVLLSDSRLGQALASRHLLIIPEDLAPPEILKTQMDLINNSRRFQPKLPREELFRTLLTDPTFHRLHCSILEATDSERPLEQSQREEIVNRVRKRGTSSLSQQERREVAGDSVALRELHAAYWAETSWKRHFMSQQFLKNAEESNLATSN